LVTVGVTVVFPFTPLGSLFGFTPPPVSFLLAMAIIVGLYVFAGEAVKRIFYRRIGF
jgi:P-type Mg2+ transporter